MHFGFPFRIDARGRTGDADEEAHVRQLIEQVLFTSPGERVNRPAFGSGLMNLVFAPANDALTAAVQQLVQSALQQALGDRIQIDAVRVASEESTLKVRVEYVIRRSQERRVAELSREV